MVLEKTLVPGLAVAAAAVVVYQSTRVAVWWDISDILEHASRISRGDIPYREFGIPHGESPRLRRPAA